MRVQGIRKGLDSLRGRPTCLKYSDRAGVPAELTVIGCGANDGDDVEGGVHRSEMIP